MRLAFLAALAAAAMLIIPSAAFGFGPGPCVGDDCPPPTLPSVASDSSSTSANEGSAATMTGTWSSPTSATLTASVGTVTKNSGGTWSWSWTPGEGPGDSRDVTISINDVADSTTFHVDVNNLAPTLTGLTVPAGATTTAPFQVSILGASDPSPADAAALTYGFDCGSGSYTFVSIPTYSCPAPSSEGLYTIRAVTRDPQFAVSAAQTRELGVFNPVSVNEGTAAGKVVVPSVGLVPNPLGGYVLGSTGVCISPAPTASIGLAFVGLGGTVSWSYGPSDGPQSATVVVDYWTEGALSCAVPIHHQVRFDLTVNNVAPTATFSTPAAVAGSTSIPLSLTSPSDPSMADASQLTYSFDCGSGYSTPGSTSSSSCAGGTTTGDRTVKGKVIDKDGGFTEYTRQVSVDATAPDTALGAHPPLVDGSATPAFDWSGTDVGSSVDGYSYRVGGGAWSSFGPATSVTLPAQADGEHTFQVKSRDAAGNEDPTPATYTWTVDTTPPDTAITGKPAGVSGPDATLAWSAAGATAFAYKLDDGAWSAWTADASHAYTGLADGLHNFAVKSRDAAGNEDATPATYGWVVDGRPATVGTPSQPGTNGSNGADGSNGSNGSDGTTVTTPATSRCKVPNLRNKKLAAAKKALRKAHCKLGKVKKKHVHGVRHGQIASQTARAGRQLVAGAKVGVVVAR